MYHCYTMQEIKEYNKLAGFHFFDDDTMRFFNSRIGKRLYQGPTGVYFVTSEKFDYDSERMYTVRQFNPDEKNISTIGEFNQLTQSEARTLAIKSAQS